MSNITTSTIRTLLRYLLNETAISKVPGDVFTYGSSSVFTLTEDNPIAITDVIVNDISSGISYAFDSSTNKLTISTSMTSGSIVEIQYTYYPNYSDTELDNYIRLALVHLSINNYKDFEIDTTDYIYPEPETNEKNLIAFIAATLITPSMATYRLPDMTIQSNEKLSVDDKIRKALAIFKHQSHGLFTLS